MHLAFTVMHFAGHIVALLQQVPTQGPIVLGVGKVITPPPNIVTNTETALVYVAHVEAASPERNTHSLHVGQYMIWQKNLLALCGQNKASQEENKQQPQSEPFTEPEPTISNVPPQDPQKDEKVLK